MSYFIGVCPALQKIPPLLLLLFLVTKQTFFKGVLGALTAMKGELGAIKSSAKTKLLCRALQPDFIRIEADRNDWLLEVACRSVELQTFSESFLHV